MTPNLSLTMIVKNEKATLGDCLSSVCDLVDEMIVVDTGSSDNTKDIACLHGAKVFDFSWCDHFAAARNEAIRHASGQWLFWMDADEHLDDANRNQLRTLLANLRDDNTAYAMKCLCLADPTRNTSTSVDHVRLFRNHPAIRWEYRIHEQILPSLKRAGHVVHFTGITITHTGYQDLALRFRKRERNLRLLHLDLAEHPDDSFTLFNLGWTYTELGRFAEAVPLLQRSLQQSHNADSITPKLYTLLTVCHRRLGQFAEAWAVCQAGNARCPDDAELLFLKGQLCHQRGDRATARVCWGQVIAGRGSTGPMPSGTGGRSDAPSYITGATSVPPQADGVFGSIDEGLYGPLVRYHLAKLDHEEGRLADAEKQWRDILDATPGYHPARLGLAELYLQQERWPELESILAELQPHAPVDVAILRSRMFLARKEFATARQLLEDVLRQAPQFLPAQVLLSHVLLQSGDENAAEPLLRRIVEMDPGQAESWRNLAVLYRRRNRLPEAIAAAKAGCFHCPRDPALLLLHGALLHEASDALNAETCLLRVLEMDGPDAASHQRRTTARQQLIALYRNLGRQREAEAHRRALAAASGPLQPVCGVGPKG